MIKHAPKIKMGKDRIEIGVLLYIYIYFDIPINVRLLGYMVPNFGGHWLSKSEHQVRNQKILA